MNVLATDNTTTFYHYTDLRSAQRIVSTGFIKESRGRFAHYGSGVYGTTISPSAGKHFIALNNWRGGATGRVRSGRADYAIRVTMPRSAVRTCYDGSRDIILYPGRLNLNNYQWDLVLVS